MKAIEIFKGDDSDAFSIRKVRIRLATPLSVSGATAEFKLLDYTKEFTADEVSANEMYVSFSRDQIAAWPVGYAFGSFKLFDNTDPSIEPQVMCATTKIPFLIRTPDKTEQQTIDNITVNTEYASVTVGWAIEYSPAIQGKPKLNDVEIDGSKTAKDYGLMVHSDFASLDPDNSSVADVVNALKGTNA